MTPPSQPRLPPSQVQQQPPPVSQAGPYLPADAIADAMSGPLEVVGVGGWPGLFRRLSCMYRNERVFVVDESCSSPAEPTQLTVHVFSPTRGQATLYAESARKITAAKRADYTQFGAANANLKPSPARLDLTQTYEDVIAYQTDGRGQIPIFCTASITSPEGHCTKGATMTPGEYAARVSSFVAEPPDSWFALVRTLVEHRKVAHAAIKPAQLPTPRLVTWAASFGRDLDVTVSEELLARIGTTGVSSAAVLTEDGGVAIAGTRSSGPNNVMPAVARVDANGKVQWVKTFAKKGFVSHEGTSVLAAGGALYVLTSGYPNLARKPITRVFKLDARGNVSWEWDGNARDNNKDKIPQVIRINATSQGTLLLTGYIQLVPNGDVHGWTAELDTKGKLVREDVGAVLPDHGMHLK
jgi:hypothetical protein